MHAHRHSPETELQTRVIILDLSRKHHTHTSHTTKVSEHRYVALGSLPTLRLHYAPMADTARETLLAATATEQEAARKAVEDLPPQQPSGLQSLPFKDRYQGARDEVPVFEGKTSYSAEAFYTKVVFDCDTYFITAASDRVRIAMSRLEGDAAKFQVDLSQTGEMPSTLEELSAKLKARYPVSPEETAPYLLLHKVSLTGNQMSKYLQEFNRQVSRLGPGEAGLQQLLQELFLSGLPTSLRQIVEQSRPEMGWTSLEAMESSATKAQQTLHLGKTNSSSSTESGKRASQPAHDKAPKRTRFGDRASGSTYCTHCNKAGHETCHCQKLKAEQSKQNPSKN